MRESRKSLPARKNAEASGEAWRSWFSLLRSCSDFLRFPLRPASNSLMREILRVLREGSKASECFLKTIDMIFPPCLRP